MSFFEAYPEYRDSGVEWLTEFPSEWHSSYLGFECTVKARLGWRGLKADEYVEDGYIFLATPNIKDKEIDFSNVNFITEARFLESPEIILSVGDVLVTKDGSTTGTTNVVRALPKQATVNSSIAVLRPSRSVVSTYLYYFFRADYTQNIISRMRGGMGVPHLFQADLRKFFMLLPSEVEQQKIANFLDHETAKIDTLIDKQQQLIKLLKEKRQAVISHAVTKGLNPAAPMKDSGVEWLGEVPEGWVSVPLKMLVSTRKGVAFKSTDFCDSGTRVVKASDLKNQTVNASEVYLPVAFSDVYRNAILQTGDIILSTVGSNPDVRNSAVGQIGMVPAHLDGSLLNQNTVVFDPNEKLIQRQYFFYLLHTQGYRDHLDLNAHGTANQSSLSIVDMLNIVIPLPSIVEQKTICEFLTNQLQNIRDLKEYAKKSEQLLKERRTALISAAVTGKIDVRNWQPSKATSTPSTDA